MLKSMLLMVLSVEGCSTHRLKPRVSLPSTSVSERPVVVRRERVRPSPVGQEFSMLVPWGVVR